MQFGFGAKVHPHAQHVLDFELQTNDAQQRSTGWKIDEQIEVASVMVEAPGDRAEHTHTACPMCGCESQHMSALRGECLGRTHR